LAKADFRSHKVAEGSASLAITFAATGLWFRTRGAFRYAGRSVVGLSPTLDDIALARACLIRKRTSANLGAVLAGAGLTCLLTGVHISL